MSFRNDQLGLVSLYMAFLAKRYAIVDIVSKRLMGSPRLDVVSMKVHAAGVALLAGVVVTMKHLLAPLLVLVSATRNLTFGLAPSVSGVSRTALKVLGGSPFRACSTTLDSFFPRFACFGILHLFQRLLATPCAAFRRTGIGVQDGEHSLPCSLRFLAVPQRFTEIAFPLGRVVSAATRTVRRHVVVSRAPLIVGPRHIEAIATDRARQIHARRDMFRVGAAQSLFAHRLVLTLTRTRLATAMLQPGRLDVERGAAYRANAHHTANANGLFVKAKLGILGAHMNDLSCAMPAAVSAARRLLRASIIPSFTPYSPQLQGCNR